MKCDGCHYTVLLFEVQESMRGTHRASAEADCQGLYSPCQVCQDKPRAIFTANLTRNCLQSVFTTKLAPVEPRARGQNSSGSVKGICCEVH